ncbi:MAG: LysR family transcriptional regulator [Rhodobacteraceae bacterium]|nr:MAG: LysR family transcriptional regulator [Paracoccaceae bacterium]
MRYQTILHYIEAAARYGSIRRAAEELALTPSAMNRRIQAFEAELGEKVFERLPQGVRLNPAGELLLFSARKQIAEMDRLRSQIADLSGMRRGHVSVACSQALAPYFLPAQVMEYNAQYPHVTFNISVSDRGAAEHALADFSADFALIFGATHLPEVEVVLQAQQVLHVIMARDHPLAEQDCVRLRDALHYPLALPTKAFAGRQMLDLAMARSSVPHRLLLESDSFEFLKSIVAQSQALMVQIPIGTPTDPDGAIVSRKLDSRDVPHGTLSVLQLRGRNLSVAAARFLDQVIRALEARFHVT